MVGTFFASSSALTVGVKSDMASHEANSQIRCDVAVITSPIDGSRLHQSLDIHEPLP